MRAGCRGAHSTAPEGYRTSLVHTSFYFLLAGFLKYICAIFFLNVRNVFNSTKLAWVSVLMNTLYGVCVGECLLEEEVEAAVRWNASCWREPLPGGAAAQLLAKPEDAGAWKVAMEKKSMY